MSSAACITIASSIARIAFDVSIVVELAAASSFTASAAASRSALGSRMDVLAVSASGLLSSRLICSRLRPARHQLQGARERDLRDRPRHDLVVVRQLQHGE